MFDIKCQEIWGGIHESDINVQTPTTQMTMYSQAAEDSCGGDIYSVSVCAEEALTRIVIADVVGHGQVAANVSQWLHQALKKYLNIAQANLVLQELNSTAQKFGIKALTTAFVLDVYRHHGKVYYANAGHQPALFSHAGELDWHALKESEDSAGAKKMNLPLGADADTEYLLMEYVYQPGDRFFLFTDGLIEAHDMENNLFGINKLIKVLNHTDGSYRDSSKAVAQALNNHCEAIPLRDDTTFISMEIRQP